VQEDDGDARPVSRAERAAARSEIQRRRGEQESAKAQLLVDRFVARAKEMALPTEELTARPWSGRGRYRTGVVGWYLRTDRSIGVGLDGGYRVLVVAPTRFGRLRTVTVRASPPPLVVGAGARDGEPIDIARLLEQRLQWPGPLEP
jgi:hypothetical protein